MIKYWHCQFSKAIEKGSEINVEALLKHEAIIDTKCKTLELLQKNKFEDKITTEILSRVNYFVNHKLLFHI